ncbi:hypothetical protein [Pseudomonas guariconensis]|uniref:hypothetical protein n=1 Tax=Pseudomonas guariconensis TaxID=1288410 RepID=UPI0018A913D4|nr:hypothetical protein [Pseudomonas guariconensis]MBF8721379.1 hypothetical protein [Pseudomonas guariconensis]
MSDVGVIERVLYVVDKCLRSQFPDDYHKRCMYASFGIHRLLEGMGYKPEIVGGDFLAFVISKDGRDATLQGYGSPNEPVSHFWVELEGAIIDLGTYYLPTESSYPASEMPAIYWGRQYALPKGLRYRETTRCASSESSYLDPHIREKMTPFLEACVVRMAKPLVKPKLGKWLATSPSSVHKAAVKGDLWARSLIRYQTMQG